MSSSPNDVLVLNSQGEFLQVVPAAIARFTLKQSLALVTSESPFTIQLNPGMTECPSPPDKYARAVPEVDVVRRQVGAQESRMNTMFNPAQDMFEAVSFFETVSKENGGDQIVWAKATAPKGMQVIVEVKTTQGTRIRIPPIRPGDPICLSRFAPFDVLKNAPDLLQNAVDGNIKLMTHKQANDWFAKKASVLKTDVSSLQKQADQNARNMIQSKPLSEAQVDRTQKIQTTAERVYIDDAINPRLQHLAAQVQPLLKEDDKMPVKDLMSELLDLEDNLTMEDYEYIRSCFYYPSVKKWAEQQQHALASAFAPETDELS